MSQPYGGQQPTAPRTYPPAIPGSPGSHGGGYGPPAGYGPQGIHGAPGPSGPPAGDPRQQPHSSARPRRIGVGLINIASVGCVGVMAGIFWAFVVSVMPGLAALDDTAFVAAMQHINAAIENPVFGFVFVGGLIFPAIAVVLELRAGRRRGALLAAAGLGCYVVTLAITMVVNIPLNDALAAASHGDTVARAAFEDPWNAAHLVRTFTCTAGMLLLIKVACGHAAGRDH